MINITVLDTELDAMSDECNHDLAEQETACADGFCPICATAEIVRLKGEAESWEKVFDRTCEHLAEVKTELAEVRDQRIKICEAAVKLLKYLRPHLTDESKKFVDEADAAMKECGK
jgi:hypothetical protein